jgi:hypothetical protein
MGVNKMIDDVCFEDSSNRFFEELVEALDEVFCEFSQRSELSVSQLKKMYFEKDGVDLDE